MKKVDSQTENEPLYCCMELTHQVRCWVFFGLAGGGIYLYFAGRMLVVRRVMLKREIRIGKPETVKLYDAVLILWGLIAIATIIMAVAVLPGM